MGYFEASTGRYRQVGEVAGLTLAQVKSIQFDAFDHGRELKLAGGNVYRYVHGNTLAADDIFVIKPNTGGGRLLLAQGQVADLSLPFTFATADAAALATLPAGFALLVQRGYWEITADLTGGASSAIGLSSSQAPHNTKGDILGGAGGDVAASLTAAIGRTLGTVGADVAGGILLKAAATIRFDRITSAFTAGGGNAHVVASVIASP